MHMAGDPILSEPTLLHDVRYLLEQAGVTVGVHIDVNTPAILRTLSLAIATGAEVPFATPMASTFGGEG